MSTTPSAASAVGASQTLKGVALLEKDVNGDVFIWSFPSLVEKATFEVVVKNRSGLIDAPAAASSVSASFTSTTPSSTLSPFLTQGLAETPFRFSRYQNHWIYQLSFTLDSPAIAAGVQAAARNKKLVAQSITLLSSSYNPPKYLDLLKLMQKALLDESSPTILQPQLLQQIYLSLFTTNKYSHPTYGSFDDQSNLYDPRRAMISPLKYLITLFRQDSILIWIAMLLKKRVVVYHPKLSECINLVKIFPLLGAFHRQDFSMLRPQVNVHSEVEIAELVKSGVFVAGVTDSSIQQHRELYDLYIDVESKQFTFGETRSSNVKDGRPLDFNLTKFHRTTAEIFVEASTKGDQDCIKAVASSTKEFLDKVAALKAQDPTGVITHEGLAAAGLPVAMQAWCFAVASAEGLTKKA